LTAATSLDVKRFRVLNTTTNIKDILWRRLRNYTIWRIYTSAAFKGLIKLYSINILYPWLQEKFALILVSIPYRIETFKAQFPPKQREEETTEDMFWIPIRFCYFPISVLVQKSHQLRDTPPLWWIPGPVSGFTGTATNLDQNIR
jgi:hypothetical protein